MAIETERRFLVANDDWNKDVVDSVIIVQGYLTEDPERTTRVRIIHDAINSTATLTIKGIKEVGSGLEFEYPIPLLDAYEIIGLCKSQISKTRYNVRQIIGAWMGDGEDNSSGIIYHSWEVDVFSGDNEGLIIAELELDDINEDLELPSWISEEITSDVRYANSNLSAYPYKTWRVAMSRFPFYPG